jgi:hypothetical protein
MSDGPSGPNCDNLFGLISGLREMGVVDEDMSPLEDFFKIVRAVMRSMPAANLFFKCFHVSWLVL